MNEPGACEAQGSDPRRNDRIWRRRATAPVGDGKPLFTLDGAGPVAKAQITRAWLLAGDTGLQSLPAQSGEAFVAALQADGETEFWGVAA